MDIPDNGSVIVFSKAPQGSYASVGVRYKVTYSANDIYVQNVETKTGTYDRKYSYKYSEWRYVWRNTK